MATKTATAKDPSGIIPMEEYTGFLSGQKSPWKKWAQSQGVPIHTGERGVSLYDLYAAPVEKWGETGGNAAIINFETGELTDAIILDIPPGGQIKPIHHVFQKAIFVLEGRGATSVWSVGSKKKQTFEWQRGSLFGIPLNAWHEHFNGSGSETARLLCVTTAPVGMNLNPGHDFIFNNSYVFDAVFSGQDDYFSSDGIALPGRLWQSNFIADVRAHEVETWRERGAGGTNRQFNMGSNHFNLGISEFPVGTYKKAHRHGPGAHIITLEGSGYTLEWNQGKELVEFPWKNGTCYTALNSFWHQHFNTGPKPVRYLKITNGRYHTGLRARPSKISQSGLANYGDNMDYEEQDPWIREKFHQECAKNGVAVDDFKMSTEYELSFPPDSQVVRDDD